MTDLTPREVLTFVPLLIMAFWIGLYPKPFFQILEQPVNQIVQDVRGSQANVMAESPTQKSVDELTKKQIPPRLNPARNDKALTTSPPAVSVPVAAEGKK